MTENAASDKTAGAVVSVGCASDGESRQDATEPGQRKARLLIVDDEPAVRDILSRSLQAGGYECVPAGEVAAALAELETGNIDLVLSDIMMPGRSGIDLLGEVTSRWPDVGVIMLTAVADTSTAIHAMRLGAFDYIIKPFNLEEVQLSVERALEKRNLVLSNREYQQFLEQKVEEQTAEIRETSLGAIQALAEALEAKDAYTNGHTRRVTEVTAALAREKGLSEEEVAKIRLAGLLHDIGKIGVPEEILQKPSRLTADEFEQISQHSVIGERILRPLIRDREILAMVRHHHERFAGGGYPEGISGEEIPLGSRLMAVADAYDAMTSNRPYRKALSPEEARRQLLQNRGIQFDPEAVDLFIQAEEKLPYCPLSAGPGSKPGKLAS